MVVDSSALAAILLGESDGPEFVEQLSGQAETCISAATYVEIGAVLSRRFREAGLMSARSIVDLFAIEICDVTGEQAQIAQEAYLRFGKGLHPAGLNYGDCFVYALAKARRQPVLCKGPEFGKTDIAVVD
jgi:ribonuclease VapC